MCPNAGNETLLATLSLQARGPNLLEPELWLNQATEYTQTYAADNTTCQQYAVNQEPLCIDFDATAGTASMQVCSRAQCCVHI